MKKSLFVAIGTICLLLTLTACGSLETEVYEEDGNSSEKPEVIEEEVIKEKSTEQTESFSPIVGIGDEVKLFDEHYSEGVDLYDAISGKLREYSDGTRLVYRDDRVVFITPQISNKNQNIKEAEKMVIDFIPEDSELVEAYKYSFYFEDKINEKYNAYFYKSKTIENNIDKDFFSNAENDGLVAVYIDQDIHNDKVTKVDILFGYEECRTYENDVIKKVCEYID